MSSPRAASNRRTRAEDSLMDVSPPRHKRPTTAITKENGSPGKVSPPREMFCTPSVTDTTRHVKYPGWLESPQTKRQRVLTPTKPTLAARFLQQRKKTVVVRHFTLKLHPTSASALSPAQRDLMASLGLYAIELNATRPSLRITRKLFAPLAASFDTTALGSDHCTLTYDDRVVLLRDKSPKGILVNKRRIPLMLETHLRTGDVVQLVPGLSYVLCKRVCDRDTKQRFVPKPKRQLHATQSSIVVFAASPFAGMDRVGQFHPMPALPLETDFHVIQNCIHDAAVQSGHVPSICVSAKPGMLEELQYTATQRCQVLHLIGRGSASSVYFEDSLSLVHPVSYDALRHTLSFGKVPPFRLVVLSYDPADTLASVFVSIGVPHVIVMRECSPVVHRALLSGLYRALAKRKSVEQAVAVATQACVAEFPDEGANKMVLLPSTTPHTEVLFALEPKRKLRHRVVPRPTPLYENLPPLCDGFCNRSLDLFKITKLLSSKRRLISITGEAGIGKSAVAKALARHISLRTSWVVGLTSPVRYLHVPTVVAATPPNSTMWAHLWHTSQTLEGTESDYSWPSVLILDGCDALTATDADRLTFRDLLCD
ncbi:hypothetical protein SPRG_08529 [Saprolegnia parasitica CBS 223.65]|uniref:FHA domain-containing protein n=1 Tax=Saprolegnia parasitica (strain CBS 223.65) TaxID=695850 RepID=A0A067C6R4_SAPPC|nr:hypothetical protein SPRG_08529 [Saprolegnia parasitica CBS 223.65]KDO26168.1 hypothetical protein SPRG_08529 [Saprolegnia parasitica CBS 223.65]|eukprot:XP_012203162.1 hypothetical protein SPRG_08529 [Saprolegnia parasitica CBS 223.65]